MEMEELEVCFRYKEDNNLIERIGIWERTGEWRPTVIWFTLHVSISAPSTNKHPSSVSMIALHSTYTPRSTMVHLSLIAHVEPCHKNRGLCLSISTIMFTWGNSSFKKNYIVIKFLWWLLGWLFKPRRIQ